MKITPLHFEDLWEKCESFHKEFSSQDQLESIIQELELKTSLYSMLSNKALPEEEKNKIKIRTFGEMLLTLTNLSLKDNINVYEALSMALQYREIDKFSQKYKK